MDKRIENAMNKLINTEIWSSNLYLSMQVYFEEQQLPILSSWLSLQARNNMERVHKIMELLYHYGGNVEICEMKNGIQRWDTPKEALDKLVEQEQGLQKDVKSFLISVQNLDEGFYDRATRLYSDRSYIGNVFLELLHVLTYESQRRLPLYSDLDE
ncbi:MAG: ferritin [Paraprevotella sp.]|nr:ferritin [Paraprevotella sp.]